MRKIILSTIVFICTVTKNATAQYWSAVGKGIGHLYTYNYCDYVCDGSDGPITGPPIASICMYNGELYAAGYFDYLSDINGYVNNIAKWNGTSWSAVGSGIYTVGGGGYDSWVYALAVYKGELYAGGYFTEAGGVPVNNIAKWDGTKWTAVGDGLGGYGYSVSSLIVYDDELYAGGYFYNSGNGAVKNIAKWDGSNWSAVGTGITVYYDDYFHGSVVSFAVHNGALYVGGYFDTAGSVATKNIAKWNGTHWSSVGAGLDTAVFAIASYNGKLYAGGGFENIKTWDGINWSPLVSVSGGVYSFTIHDSNLIAGGYFATVGITAARNIARWNGTNWTGLGNGISSGILSMTTHDDVLYAGGDFNTAGNVVANRIAAWREQCNSVPEQPGNITRGTTTCQNSYSVFYVDPVTNAADFTWNLPPGWSGNSSSNRITVLAGTTDGTISVIANNPCGSSTAQTIRVNALNSVPIQLDTIKGEKTVCKDSYQIYSIDPVPEATNYVWILPTGWTGYSNTNTIRAKAGISGGVISVRARNSCSESNAQTFFVSMIASPQPGIITGSNSVNNGQSANYSIAQLNGATSYSWALNGGGTIVSGQNTNSILVSWQTPGNYVVSVKANYSCGTSIDQTLVITVSMATGVINAGNSFEIKILPNPSSGEFFLRAKDVQNKVINVEILNIAGQLVYRSGKKQGANDYTQLINLVRMPQGIYTVKIMVDDKVYTRSVVINN